MSIVNIRYCVHRVHKGMRVREREREPRQMIWMKNDCCGHLDSCGLRKRKMMRMVIRRANRVAVLDD